MIDRRKHHKGTSKGNMMAATDALDYLRAFKTRRDYCRELFDLSEHQSELITADDYSALLTKLGRKQRILGRMQELKSQQPEL